MEKLSMGKLKEILRLRHECNLSARQISRALNISHTVVNNYLSKVHTPEQFGQPADLHPDTLPELIRTASRFIFGQF